MKFQVDSMPTEALRYLKSMGHEVETNLDWGDGTQADRSILLRAYANKRIVITADKDFDRLVNRDNLPNCGVVRYTQNIGQQLIGPKILTAIQEHQSGINAGEIVVVTNHNNRASVSPPQKKFSRTAKAVTWKFP